MGIRVQLLGLVAVAVAGPYVALAEAPATVADLATRWSGDRASGFGLEVEFPENLTWSVQVKARLGALRTEWSQEGIEASRDGTVQVTLDPPPTAWLHDLAADYVTGLAVTLVGVDAEGRQVVIKRAPPAFLVWPEGRAGAPVVWDLETMKVHAPAGVVNDELRASLGDLTGVDRVGPPIYAERSFSEEDLVEGGE